MELSRHVLYSSSSPKVALPGQAGPRGNITEPYCYYYLPGWGSVRYSRSGCNITEPYYYLYYWPGWGSVRYSRSGCNIFEPYYYYYYYYYY